MAEPVREKGFKLAKVWSPQPGPQLAAIQATWCNIILFGGAKYGGKSDFLLGDFLQDVPTYGSNWHGIIVRQSQPELDEIKMRAQELYPRTGAKWGEAKSTWFFREGATLKFRHVENDRDIANYFGHSYTWIGLDEVGKWPTDTILRAFAIANLRWGRAHVPTKRIRLTANPQGAGHSWLKRLFIDPNPRGFVPFEANNGMSMMFIPSRITDNKEGLAKDPNYIKNLEGVGSKELVKAWLEGDWNALTGSFFTAYDARLHQVAPFRPPVEWFKYATHDWGMRDPHATIWWCVSSGEEFTDDEGRERWFPRGSIIAYREWLGCDPADPSKGANMRNEDIARGIMQRTLEELDSPILSDTLPFQDRGFSRAGKAYTIADVYADEGCQLKLGNSRRIHGAAQITSRLIGMPVIETSDERLPLIYFTEDCPLTQQYLAAISVDGKIAETYVDSGEATHLVDCVKLACSARPLTRENKKATEQDLLREAEANIMTFAGARKAVQKEKRKRGR